MKTKIVLFGLVGLPFVGLLLGVLLGVSSISQDESSRPIIGSVRTFEAAYGRWKADAERSGHSTKLVLSLGHFKGLSSEFSQAHGTALLDLANGSLSVQVAGLPQQQNYEVWLVHNRPGPGRSVKPENGDRMIRAGVLTRQGENAVLAAHLERDALADFKLDLMVVTPAGHNPAESALVFGAPNVFQKLYYSERSTEKLIFTRLGGLDDGASTARHLLFTPFRSLIPNLAHADRGGIPNLRSLLVRGERLFFEETFKGNGRTCGTCHPAENNFTIDEEFIKTLPLNDPLFVAEFNNDLNSEMNGGKPFEISTLMRDFGLILENVDGTDDLKNKFVMRGTPHTFSQALSITPATFDGTSPLVLQRTGWGGDGAPGTGTLREFAIGAVTQHFTRTLNRKAGVDFRLPNDAQLDAMEAFMLSLGRQAELDLSTLDLQDPNASLGLDLFNSPVVGKCSFCHFNAGATHGLVFLPGFGVQNANFDTGVENAPHPAGPHGLLRPHDGGFGRDPNALGGFGNHTFNTPPLVEAADKRTFFHNNLCNTIECAVEFYASTAFNSSLSAGVLPGGGINLTQTQSDQIAAFLRVINALENIRSAEEKLTNALHGVGLPEVGKLLRLGMVDIKDADRVLKQVPLSLNPFGDGLHTDAQARLGEALGFCETAQLTKSKVARNSEIKAALSALAQAKGDIVNP